MRFLILAALLLIPAAASAQCVGPGGINTVGTCPAAVSPVASDVGLFYQPAQTPHTRKMSLAQIAAYVSGQFPTKTEVSCGGVDDTTLIQGVFTTLAASGGQAIVHGHCVLTAAVTQTLSVPAALTGDGPEVTSFTFSGATSGFSIMLDKVSGQWGTLVASGFSVIRGPTSPVSANTGFKVYANPAVGAGYSGMSAFSDIVVRGSSTYTNQWANGMVLSGIGPSMRNMRILGINGGGTDLGDVGLTLDGPNFNQFGAYVLDASLIQGYSVGVNVTGYVQGVFVGNGTSIIGDYDGIRWVGVSAAANYTTNGVTALGNGTLHFAAGTLGSIQVGDIANGTGVAPNARVQSINNGAGTLVVSPVATGTVMAGAVVGFQHNQFAEELAVVNSSFNASHRGIYASFGGWHSVMSSTFLRFGSAAPTWAAIEFYENNNFVIANNPGIYGQATGTENGIIINSTDYVGDAPGTITGNVGGSLHSAWIALQGTTTNTVVSGNNCFGCLGGNVSNANPASNLTFVNRYNDTNDISLNTSTGVLTTPYSFSAANLTASGLLTATGDTSLGANAAAHYNVSLNAATGASKQFLYNSAGLNRWIQVVSGANGGGDTGDDMSFCRSSDAGTLIDCPVLFARSTGSVSLLHDISASNIVATGALTASSTRITTTSTVAGIGAAWGTCNAGINGKRGLVSDAAATPAFWGVPTGGGTLTAPIFCNGSAWVYG
jgi:hypothetical protein